MYFIPQAGCVQNFYNLIIHTIKEGLHLKPKLCMFSAISKLSTLFDE